MPRFPVRFLPLLLASSAFAQAQAEAPVEKANLFTVVVFLAIFVGSCAGYFVYLWWNHKRRGATGEAEQPGTPRP